MSLFGLTTNKNANARLDALKFELTDKFNRQLTAISTALSVATGKSWEDIKASISEVVQKATTREAAAAEKVRVLQAELRLAQKELGEAHAARVEVENVLYDISATAVPGIQLAALATPVEETA